jgi:hypothetical protein
MIDGFRSQGARTALVVGVAVLVALQPFATAFAGPNEQAELLFSRITGTEPSASVLTQMASDISANNPNAAAAIAMADPNFYNVTIRNFAAPMSNKSQSVFVPLNDYTATIVGMIRDNVPFNTVLSADMIYVGNVTGIPAYSTSDNSHYQYLDNTNADLSNPAVLQQQTQSSVIGIPSAATAGVITTEASAAAYFYLGTNRAMVRFTMINYMCNDLNAIEDITRPPDRIRQDPSRSPGGDSRTFLNTCIGCHSGMDALAGAFAYYNVNVGANTNPNWYPLSTALPPEQYTPGSVQMKYGINTGNFPYGYVTTDDSWINHWRAGPNSVLGWSSTLPGQGNGAKAFGQEIESSQQFATCQVQKAFQAMCLRPPGNAADFAEVSQVTSDFVSANYNMKTAFGETAVYCMGQ